MKLRPSRDAQFWAEFWACVHSRQKAYAEAIRIIKTRQRIVEVILPPPGSPPYQFRPAFEVAGRRDLTVAEAEEAQRVSLRRAAISVAEAKENQRLMGRHLACDLEEFAVGVHQFELRDSKRKGSFKRLVLDPLEGDDSLGSWQMAVPSSEELAGAYSIETLPEELILTVEDRELCARILAKSPGRKRGRPSGSRNKVKVKELA
jgi:hypothetical protein